MQGYDGGAIDRFCIIFSEFHNPNETDGAAGVGPGFDVHSVGG